MSHFTGRVDSRLYSEILERSHKQDFFKCDDKVRIDPELLKNTYLEMLQAAGVDILLYTLVCDVIKNGDRVCGVITENKSGRRAYLADVLIDGTGDGDLACRAGAEYFKGRESDGKMQPATLMFKVGGVDMSRAAGACKKTAAVPGGSCAAVCLNRSGYSHLQYDKLHRDRRHKGRGSHPRGNCMPLANGADYRIFKGICSGL